MNGIGNHYLLDTNILIYYFNGDTIVQPVFSQIITGTASGFYSPITWVELLCYPGLTKEEASQIRNVLRSLNCVALTETVLDRSAEIRRNHRTALPDSIIAACAIESSSVLVTRNTKDFQQITDLNLLNPFTA